jgi:hypothetical protein
MTLGMSLDTFTLVHVIISLLGIGSGVVVVFGMLNSKRFDGLTLFFLITTALTSITGFMFPLQKVTPGIILGVISMVVLIPATLARYTFHLSNAWRWIYVVSAVAALYFNVFVLIAQSFQKIPALKALAPTQSETPFAVVQGLAFVFFIMVGSVALKQFRPESGENAKAAVAR